MAPRRIAHALIILTVVAPAVGCAPSGVLRPARVVTQGDDVPPRIVVPAASAQMPRLDVDPKARAATKMRGWFPARDGDPIAVVLSPVASTTPTAETVRDEVLAPLLRAIGFHAGVGALRMPPSAGLALPQPRFAPLAEAVALDYAANPALMRPETHEMLEVFLGKRPADEDVDRALLMGEGMTFAQYRAGIQRREIIFPFVQVHSDPVHGTVPIEHALLLATAWEGETIRSVQGALLGNVSIVNTVSLTPASAGAAAQRALVSVRGFDTKQPARPPRDTALVLLPFGTHPDGQPRLRYAYRMRMDTAWRRREVPVLLWADADSGKILALEPARAPAGASGRTFNRDVGIPGSLLVPFTVDGAGTDGYVLANTSVAIRLNYRAGAYDNNAEVSIAPAGNGSTISFANFDQPLIQAAPDFSDVRCVVPATGNALNHRFQQVSVFATIMRHRQTVVGGGIFEPFPEFPWAPTVEYSDWGCNADSYMQFGQCEGYLDPGCPDTRDLLLNFAHDNTMIAHELGHNATIRLAQGRPLDWCNPGGPPTCTPPRAWTNFHDLADFWAAHLESTNCIGGWVGKNVNGTNASRLCMPAAGTHGHNERDWFPRKLELMTGRTIGDHFPEHRNAPSTSEWAGGHNAYADGQILGAALWEVRAGMRSKCRPSGIPQFGVRFQRAMQHAGFFDVLPTNTDDLGMYRRQVELLFKLTEQWATAGLPGGPPAFAHNGAHTTNKVTAGFARAGLFLVPWQCLDGDPSNDAALECPASSPGADAVVDIDDNDESDDDQVNGVTVVDRDFLKDAASPIPKFHVWTGPLYRLNGSGGQHTRNVPAPCNATFIVEAARDATFTTGLVDSGWRTVSRDPGGAAPACYGVWDDMTLAQWSTLRAGGANSLIYYRARTRDAGGGTERISTQPGGGLWTVPPPYAVITTDGRSSY